nr:EAL domain-containing protein [Lysobacter sp. CAU 1642]
MRSIRRLVRLSRTLAADAGAEVPAGAPSTVREFRTIEESIQSLAQHLGEARDHLQRVYDFAPAVFLTVGPDGKVIDVNDFGLAALQRREDETLGIDAADLYVEEDRGEFRSMLARLFAGDVAIDHWELRRQGAAGTTCWVREAGRRIELDDVVCVLIVSQDISAQHELSEELEHRATHDQLTNLINRYEFSRLVDEAIRRARLGEADSCICFLDLDQFKVVNDVCGHMAGDELLKQIADCFRERLRRGDHLARIGGDEFGLLLEGCSVERAVQIIDGLRSELSARRFTWDDRFFEVGLSAGVAGIESGTVDVQQCLSRADSACFTAKEQGRNRTVIYREGDAASTAMLGEMQWVDRVNAAADRDDMFVLHLQRIARVDVPDEAALKGEVLVRMIGEGGQLVPPGQFIPAAERYNIAYKIDHWVLRRVIATLRRFHGVLPTNTLISINLSAQTISTPQHMDELLEILGSHLDLCHQLCFEITETAAMLNFSVALNFMKEIRSLGCQLALDDFGSGFSSFGYLRRMPVDYLKIDGMFMRELTTSRLDQALVSSIGNIAATLGIGTVAEFVDSQAGLDCLRTLGIDYAQGYFVALPEPFEMALQRFAQEQGQLSQPS